MTTTLEGHGLSIGPQDPDNTSKLTAKVGVHNKADKLLARHRANWPVQLTTALSRPRDDERSETLLVDEVQSALEALKGRRAFFNPETDELEDASVRGTTDKDRIVSVVVRRGGEFGRSYNGVLPYEGMTGSIRAYEEAVEAEKNGGFAPAALPAGDDETAAALAEAQRQRDAAEAQNRELSGTLQELQDRLAALENPEPFDGYAGMKAQDRAKRVEEGGISEFGRAGLERIATYEAAHGNSVQVLRAVDDALAASNPVEE